MTSAAGDTDEIEEIISIVQNLRRQSPPPSSTKSKGEYRLPVMAIRDDTDGMLLHLQPCHHLTSLQCTRMSLLPVLLSVAHGHLAEDYLTQHLAYRSQEGNRNGSTPSRSSEEQESTESIIWDHIKQSLFWFPHNAHTWSLTANTCRMQILARLTRSTPQVATIYQRAADDAAAVRRYALEVLGQCQHVSRCENVVDRIGGVKEQQQQVQPRDDHSVPMISLEHEDEALDKIDHSIESGDDYGSGETQLAREWVKLLLLKQVADVEWIPDDKTDDATTSDNVENEDRDGGYPTNNDKTETAAGYWTASGVEGTSRFMAAMLLSTLGRHDEAKNNILAFPAITHRIHPNVWDGINAATVGISAPATASAASPPPIATLLSARTTAPATNTTTSPELDEPCLFVQPVLPEHLHSALCQAFHPDASYWRESDYANRGYYSYFMNIDPNRKHRVTNLIEDVIFNHLLPLTEQRLPKHVTIHGVEWWVHTRPIQANLGHNLHFDTDEALLAREHIISHPVLSSVLYLTGGSTSGATVIMDQIPQAQEVAQQAWRNVPHDNTYLVFPGDRLHGVLPCRGNLDRSHPELGLSPATLSLEDLLVQQPPPSTSGDASTHAQHRLTFMVGWWTRRAPATSTDATALYGPWSPLPPATKEHSWVQQIERNYPRQMDPRVSQVEVRSVPVVSPAWEVLRVKPNMAGADEDDETPTMARDGLVFGDIPVRIDHRFFVSDAPQCFYDSLFESYEDEDDDDDPTNEADLTNEEEEEDLESYEEESPPPDAE